MAQCRRNRSGNTQTRHWREEGDDERLVERTWNHLLGVDAQRLHDHRWPLLPAVGPRRAKTQGQAGPNLLSARQREAPCGEVDSPKLLQLGWITIPHPEYSPDLAPHGLPFVSIALSNFLREKRFDDEKSVDFYERGILTLPDRWRQVIDSDGGYIDEN